MSRLPAERAAPASRFRPGASGGWDRSAWRAEKGEATAAIEPGTTLRRLDSAEGASRRKCRPPRPEVALASRRRESQTRLGSCNQAGPVPRTRAGEKEDRHIRGPRARRTKRWSRRE